MKTSFPKEGIIAALWIPLNSEGRLDREALTQHFSWLKSCGIHGVLALGSSGRFPLMGLRQRLEVLEAVAELAAPLPVIVNISDIRPKVVAELGRVAREMDLAGVAVMPPSFFRVSDADQLAFFEQAAEAAGLPVMLYNFPELTGNRISAETIYAFAGRQNMAGIKQSGGEFEYHRTLIHMGKEKNFAVFSGADTRLPEVFEMGGAGCIGGLVNLVPEYMIAQFNHYRRGISIEMEPVRSRMQEVGRIVNQLSLPLSVEAGIRARGWDTGFSPGVVSAESAKIRESIISDLGSKFAEWGLAAGPLGTASDVRQNTVTV